MAQCPRSPPPGRPPSTHHAGRASQGVRLKIVRIEDATAAPVRNPTEIDLRYAYYMSPRQAQGVPVSTALVCTGALPRVIFRSCSGNGAVCSGAFADGAPRGLPADVVIADTACDADHLRKDIAAKNVLAVVPTTVPCAQISARVARCPRR